jgi:hypothetical protein
MLHVSILFPSSRALKCSHVIFDELSKVTTPYANSWDRESPWSTPD